MTSREEFWCRAFFDHKNNICGNVRVDFENTIRYSGNASDLALAEFDKRFTKKADEFTLENMPEWERVLEGCEIEGVEVDASYSESAHQFVVRFHKEGRSEKLFTNQKEGKDALWWYKSDAGKELIANGIQMVTEDE